MAKTQQLIDDLEKRKALFNIALAGTDEGSPLGVNPIVQEAIDALKPSATPTVSPSSEEGKVNVTLGGALKGATIPFVPGQPVTGIQPGAAAATPAMQSPEAVGTTDTFLDLLMRNNELRMRNDAELKRNEKANQARTRIAAISDAIASLGNLIGTTQGAFNQPQTYSTPFVTEQVEQDRARARQMSDYLDRNENQIRMAKARQDMADRSLDRQLAVQQAITDRAAMNNEAKLGLEDKRQAGKMEIEKFKQGGRVALKQMDIDYKQNKDEMMAALRQQGIKISAGRLSEMIRHNQTIEKIRENGGGSVGGYETVIIRDEFGREVKRRRVPLGADIDLDEDDPAPWAGESGGAPWL